MDTIRIRQFVLLEGNTRTGGKSVEVSLKGASSERNKHIQGQVMGKSRENANKLRRLEPENEFFICGFLP